MATIRVTCPTCGEVLEIGAEHEGQEVECGGCLQVFVAPRPGGRVRGAPSPRGKPRRRDDEDDDYEHDHTEELDDDYNEFSGRGGGGASGAAVLGLIFGVLGLLTSCCPVSGIVLGVLAMVLGTVGKRNADGAGAATAAAVLGSIAFLISAGLLVWLFAGGGWGRLGK